MNIKKYIYILVILEILVGCKTKNQCDQYVNSINKSIELEYHQNLKTNHELFLKENTYIDPLENYTNFNSCKRKYILFTFPKDTVIVLDRIRHDDYAGTNINLTGIYKDDELLSFNNFSKGFKKIKIDNDYIFNNSHYQYIIKLKKGDFSKRKISEFSDDALKDITFITLIIDQKIKDIYRVYSNELVRIK
ncbi:hypothetical protein LF887_10765 [Chryseobacterium sp. MEBOG06]|uniref:hypothetical protein n=1 Tax=unclassified Chryseobacterium TaxID=2593645 RepID=UPI001F3358FE|nr:MULTISPECIES: hypothetical protein [unclassified Chryseobacterium]UKB86079.1 hypothetical protein LF887_10765 [Chryseobacterium sp. MEBOG06]